MSTTARKIPYNEKAITAGWDDLNKMFTKAEMVEMIQRYMETQRHAVAYRAKAQLKTKLMKAKLAELGIEI